MAEVEQFTYAINEKIRAHAMSFPDSEEGSSCVNRAFSAGGKNFVFVGEKPGQCSVRLKLADSVPDIEARAEGDPDSWQVGTGGWTLITFSPSKAPPIAELRRWVTESFHLLAPKKVVAKLNV